MYGWSLSGKHGMRLLIDDFSQYRRYDYSPVEVNDLTPEDLIRIQQSGLLRMHLTPKRILAAIKMLGFAQLLPLVIKLILRRLRILGSTEISFNKI